MKPTFFCALVLLLFVSGWTPVLESTEAGTSTIQQSADYNLYAILLETRTDVPAGRASGDLYREYRGLADLGHLYHEVARESAGTVTRVYVGSYLGEPTGQRVLAEVIRRGYALAELRIQKAASSNAGASSTLQIASIERRMDLRAFQAIRDAEGPGAVFAVIAPDDAFKVLVGYQLSSSQLTGVKNRLRAMGISSFSKPLSELL